MPLTRVSQQHDFDCGVACAAMACETSYENALAVFLKLGFGETRGKRPPLCTNYTELRAAIKHLKRETKMPKWGGWQDLTSRGILRVDSKLGSGSIWHWVVAERVSEKEVCILDPGQNVKSSLCMTIAAADLGMYHPLGAWIIVKTYAFT